MTSTMREPPLDGEPNPGAPMMTMEVGRMYVVLQLAETGENQWLELGSFPASTSEQAIRDAAAVQAADPDVDTSGVLTYVAVPARSFQPVELTARVEPKIEFRSRT